MTIAGSGTRALVTGGAGFIGSHVVDELVRRGVTVDVVDNFAAGVRANLRDAAERITVHEVDLNGSAAAELVGRLQFDLIVHLAGLAHVQQSVATPRLDFEQNLLGTFNLLEAVRERSPRSKLIFASSATVYGEPGAQTLDEDAPCRPVAPYAICKLTGEHQMRVYASLYGLRTSIVRLLSVYGPRQRKQVVFDIMRKLEADPQRLPLFGDGTEMRDLNYVGDAVDAILLVAERAPFQGEVYNVAAGETVTIRRVAELICARFGVQPEIAFAGTRRAGDTQGWIPSLARITALGYGPRVSIEAGLDETVRWFLRDGRLT